MDDVVKGKANVTKEFAKTQRQIYKLISQMPQISAAQISENMGDFFATSTAIPQAAFRPKPNS